MLDTASPAALSSSNSRNPKPRCLQGVRVRVRVRVRNSRNPKPRCLQGVRVRFRVRVRDSCVLCGLCVCVCVCVCGGVWCVVVCGAGAMATVFVELLRVFRAREELALEDLAEIGKDGLDARTHTHTHTHTRAHKHSE